MERKGNFLHSCHSSPSHTKHPFLHDLKREEKEVLPIILSLGSSWWREWKSLLKRIRIWESITERVEEVGLSQNYFCWRLLIDLSIKFFLSEIVSSWKYPMKGWASKLSLSRHQEGVEGESEKRVQAVPWFLSRTLLSFFTRIVPPRQGLLFWWHPSSSSSPSYPSSSLFSYLLLYPRIHCFRGVIFLSLNSISKPSISCWRWCKSRKGEGTGDKNVVLKKVKERRSCPK